MKKISLAILLVGLFVPYCYGATSEDMNVYVRQDVFDARMDVFMTEIKSGFARLETKIDANFEAVDNRFEAVNQRIDDLTTVIYWVLGIIGLIFASLALVPYLQNLRKPSVTMEDVTRAINEHLQALNTSGNYNPR